MRTLVAKVTEECHRMTEFLPAVVALLVASARVDHALVFFQLVVNVCEKVRVDLELGKNVSAVNRVALDLVANLYRIRDDFRMVREQCRHLLLAFQVLLLGISKSVRIVNKRIGRQANKPVMRSSVLFSHEMGVVSGNDFYTMFFRQVENYLVILLLLFVDFKRKSRNLRLMEHDFQVVIILEHPLVPLYGLFRPRYVSCKDESRNLSCHAGRRTDDVVVILLYDLVRYPRLVIHTLEMACRYDFHQVLVAVVVLRQQDKVVITLLLHPVVSLGNINLASDDRFYVRMFGGELEKFLHAVHVSMVRDGKTGHAEFIGSVEQVFYRCLTIKNGVLRMYVEVNECHNSIFLID